jgi:branched-chain amino acid transport system ATP-binding protein
MSSGVILESRHVGKRFGDFAAVTDVSWQLRAGEAAGIIGPNGAGKSTFFNLLTGLHAPTDGTVHLDGADVTRMRAERRVGLGLVRTFQLVSVFDSLTAVDNLVLSVLRAGERRRPLRFLLGDARAPGIVAPCLAALERVGMRAKADVPVSELSYGDKRRLEIALALSLKPRVLLLDEPLAGLSDGEIREILALVASLRGTLSLVIIEHKISHIVDLVSRLSVMHEGRLVAEGAPQAVLRDPLVRKVYWGDEGRGSLVEHVAPATGAEGR